MFFMSSCERYVTEISDLTLSGTYVVEKLKLVKTDTNETDSVFIVNQNLVNQSLPDPFDTIKVGRTYIYFTYSIVEFGEKQMNSDIINWEYQGINYYRILWTADAYRYGKIKFNYIPKNKNNNQTVVLNVDEDRPESLKLSGFHFSKNQRDYYVILFLNRVGP